jgi:hypothetical protein
MKMSHNLYRNCPPIEDVILFATFIFYFLLLLFLNSARTNYKQHPVRVRRNQGRELEIDCSSWLLLATPSHACLDI